jgi:putative ABC transport system permease protein
MESLVTANIRSRPTRTFISVLAVALGVILVLIIGGITAGTLDDYIKRTQGVGADFILQPAGSSIFYAFSGATLPIGLADKLTEVPGIYAVTPVLVKFSSSDFGLIFGIDLASYNRFPGKLQIIEGRESLQGDEVIVDELYAKGHKLKVGMPVTILNHKFTVSGICKPGAVVRVFGPIKQLQEMNGTPDKATLLFIKAAPKENPAVAFGRLKETFPTLSITQTADTALLLADTALPGFKEFKLIVVSVSMLLSFMVILLAMYTTIFERTREIGILRSLGASRVLIVSLILKESAMICCFGVVFGIGISVLVRDAIMSAFPTLQVAMGWKDVMHASFLGLVAGTLGALYPAYRAARQDPVKALSYE